MASAIDELHLRLVYWRIAGLAAAAVSLEQRRQATAVRNRVTAELVRRGWRVPEIAAALRMTNHRVRHWHDQGRKLEVGGLSLPYPSAEGRDGWGGGRLSVAEVAERLRVDASTIRRWIKQGRLPATRVSTAKRGPWVVEAEALTQLGVSGACLTVQEMAQRHGVHPMTVREWISGDRLPAVSVMPGGALRIPASAKRPVFAGPSRLLPAGAGVPSRPEVPGRRGGGPSKT